MSEQQTSSAASGAPAAGGERDSARAPSGWAWGLLVGAVLLLALLVATSADIATRPLETHEIFVAQTAREMLASGDWILPTFNAEPRLVKPPLMYWLVMALAEAIARDVSPLVARLPSALSGVAVVALAIWLGAIVYNRRTAIIAGLLTAGTAGFFEYANTARPEMLYAACGGLVSVGLAGAWLSQDRTRAQLWWALLAWAGAGLGVLAKGAHVPLLMMLGVAACALSTRRQAARAGQAAAWKRLRHVLRPGVGVLVLLAIGLPWVVAVLARRPDAIDVWISQVFAGPSEKQHHELLKWITPYYLAMFPYLIFPWAILLPMGLAVSFQRNRPDLARGRVLFWIIVVVVAVMSLQYHKRAYYLLPIVPAAAVLMARGTEDLLVKILAGRGRGAAIWLITGISAAASVALALLPWLDGPAGVGVEEAWAAAISLAVLAAAAGICASRGAPGAGGLLLALALAPAVCLALLGGSNGLWGQRRYQQWAFVQDVARAVGPGEPVFVYRCDASELVYGLNEQVVTLEEPGEPPLDSDVARWWLIMEEADWEKTADQWPPHALVSRIEDPVEDSSPRLALRFDRAGASDAPAGGTR